MSLFQLLLGLMQPLIPASQSSTCYSYLPTPATHTSPGLPSSGCAGRGKGLCYHWGLWIHLPCSSGGPYRRRSCLLQPLSTGSAKLPPIPSDWSLCPLLSSRGSVCAPGPCPGGQTHLERAAVKVLSPRAIIINQFGFMIQRPQSMFNND